MRIAREGYPFIALAAVLAVVGGSFSPWLGWPLTGLMLFVTAFFRSPHRVIPSEPGVLVSPADGKILVVDEFEDSRYLNRKVQRIVVFLSVFNVHVNRVPVSGKVKKIIYHSGKFLMAFAPKASLDNEQNGVVMIDEQGRELAFVQIAGLIARRIVCYLKEGDSVTRGSLYGLIRFGSRLDVYLPADYKIEVTPGQCVKGGESILARLS